MLKINVTTAEAVVTETELITAGRKGLQCEFTFNDAWDGLAKTAVFMGVVTVDVALLGTNTVVVPAECITKAQFPLKIGVYGSRPDGTIAIPTIWANFGKVLPGVKPSLISPEELTPDIVAQVIEASSNALYLARNVQNMADNGELDGVSPEVTVTEITGGHNIKITDRDHPNGQDFDVPDGVDGVSPTLSATNITGGHRITMTDANATTTFDVMDGIDGTNGVSPTIATSNITGGHRLTIVDVNGSRTVDVMDGVDGTDGADGTDGKDGSRFWTSSSAPTSPNYTFTISDLTGQTGESPIVGDIVFYSYYRYTITSVDTNAGTVLTDNRTSIRGATGATGADGADGQNGADGADGNSLWQYDPSALASGGSGTDMYFDKAHLLGRTDVEPQIGDIIYYDDPITNRTKAYQIAEFVVVSSITQCRSTYLNYVTGASGSGGTSDYSDLTNKPQINSVTLSGNKSLSDLGIQPNDFIVTITYDSGNDSYSADKTFAQIKTAKQAGKNVVLQYGNDPTEFYRVAVWVSDPLEFAVFSFNHGTAINQIMIDETDLVLRTVGSAGTYSKPSGGIPASDLASGVIPTVPSASDATPQALGTASPGSSNDYARGDHVHEDNIFWCTYGTTTSAQIEAALNAGKLVLVKYNDITYSLVYRGNATSHVFGAAKTQTVPTIYTVSCSSNVWSSATKNLIEKPASATIGDALVWDGSAWVALPAAVEVTNTSTGDVTLALDAGKIYHFTGAISSLTLTLNQAEQGQLEQYHFDFNSGSTAATVSITGVTWQGSSFTPSASKHYEVDILNGYGVVCEW